MASSIYPEGGAIGDSPHVILVAGTDDTNVHALEVDADGQLKTVTDGSVAAGATDSGNPVKVGGIAVGVSPTAVTAGQRVNETFDIYGRPQTAIGATPPSAAGTDGMLGIVIPLGVGIQDGSFYRPLMVAGALFNGANWDRARSNAPSTGLASGARTASTPTPDQTNYNGRGAKIFLDITATPNNTETLQVTIEEKDPVSNKYVQIAAFPALTASALGATPTTETYLYEIGPGISETIAVSKHELQALLLSRTWRVNVLHSAAGSWTYSVGIVNIV